MKTKHHNIKKKHPELLSGSAWLRAKHRSQHESLTGVAIHLMAFPFELLHEKLHIHLPHNRNFFMVSSGILVMMSGYYVGVHTAEVVPHAVSHTLADMLSALGSAPVVKVICDFTGIEI